MKRIDRRDGERGQALPLFVLMLVALLAATGLVVDVGSAWAQERSQQKASDVAATGWRDQGGQRRHARQAIIDAALASAVANGYQPAEVQVNIPPSQRQVRARARQGRHARQRLLDRRARIPAGSRSSSPSRTTTSSPASSARAPGTSAPGASPSVASPTPSRTASRRSCSTRSPSIPANNPENNKQYCNPQDNKCSPNNDFPLERRLSSTGRRSASPAATATSTPMTPSTSSTARASRPPSSWAWTSAPTTRASTRPSATRCSTTWPNGADLPVAINDDNGNLAGFWIWHFDAANTVCQGQDGMQLERLVRRGQDRHAAARRSSSGAPPAQVGQYIVRLVE